LQTINNLRADAYLLAIDADQWWRLPRRRACVLIVLVDDPARIVAMEPIAYVQKQLGLGPRAENQCKLRRSTAVRRAAAVCRIRLRAEIQMYLVCAYSDKSPKPIGPGGRILDIDGCFRFLDQVVTDYRV